MDAARKDEVFLREFYIWEDAAHYHTVMAGLSLERLRADLQALERPVW